MNIAKVILFVLVVIAEYQILFDSKLRTENRVSAIIVALAMLFLVYMA